jgi:ABC-type sugar transport system substrate-binding protein
MSDTETQTIDQLLTRLDTHGVRRRDLIKLLAAGTAVAGATGLLAACGDDDSNGAASVSTKDGKLTFLVMTNQLQYDVQMDQAAGDVAKQLGYSYTSVDGKLDASLQLNQFQQASAKGAKGILLHSPDGSNVQGIAQTAQSQQIYVANVWGTRAYLTPFDIGDYWTLYAQPDEYLVQGKVTQALIDKLDGKGDIVRVTGVPGNSADTIRTAGADAVLKQNPGVKLLGELPGKWNPEDSQKAMQSLLSRYPDVQGVIAQNDDEATGVIAALKGAGRKPGEDVHIIGADGTDLAAQRIKSGEQLATTANVPAYAGYLLVARLYDVQNGWKPRVPERMLQWESVILDQSNIDPYTERYVGNPSTPPFDVNLLSRVKAKDRWDPQFKLYPMADLDLLWVGNKKPSGWEEPKEFADARASGEFDEVKQEYQAAYKADVLDPSPAG